jgi:hypothetical protein
MYNDMIFNDSYFDDNSYDMDAVYEDAGAWLFANFAVFTALLVKTIIRASKKAAKSHKTIVSVNSMVAHGVPKAQAVKEAKKSIEWLRRKGYTYVDSNAQMLSYNELTEEGKQFVDGYFESIGKMDEFTIKKAVNANESKLASLGRFGDNITAILNVIIIVFYTSTTLGGLIFFPATLAMAFWAGTDLGESIVRIINKVRFKESKPDDGDAIESAYDEGYHQALADMGYDLNDEASEDVDIFDENCFNDAMESNAIAPKIRYLYNDIDSVNEL